MCQKRSDESFHYWEGSVETVGLPRRRTRKKYALGETREAGVQTVEETTPHNFSNNRDVFGHKWEEGLHRNENNARPCDPKRKPETGKITPPFEPGLDREENFLGSSTKIEDELQMIPPNVSIAACNIVLPTTVLLPSKTSIRSNQKRDFTGELNDVDGKLLKFDSKPELFQISATESRRECGSMIMERESFALLNDITKTCCLPLRKEELSEEAALKGLNSVDSEATIRVDLWNLKPNKATANDLERPLEKTIKVQNYTKISNEQSQVYHIPNKIAAKSASTMPEFDGPSTSKKVSFNSKQENTFQENAKAISLRSSNSLLPEGDRTLKPFLSQLNVSCRIKDGSKIQDDRFEETSGHGRGEQFNQSPFQFYTDNFEDRSRATQTVIRKRSLEDILGFRGSSSFTEWRLVDDDDEAWLTLSNSSLERLIGDIEEYDIINAEARKNMAKNRRKP